MTHIVTGVHEAMKVAGVDDEPAKAAAGAIPLATDLATKADIAELKADIKVLKFVHGPVVILLLLKLVFFP